MRKQTRCRDCGNVVAADGVREEFEISKLLGKTLVPIGATGHVARALWEEVSTDLSTLFPNANVASEVEKIGSEESTVEEIVQATLAILKKGST